MLRTLGLLLAAAVCKSTPLHEAVSADQRERATELMAELKISGRLHDAFDAKDAAGMTPLHRATHRGLLEMARLLIDSGAPVDAAASDTRTALHLAAGKDFLDIAKLLLASGASVDAVEASAGWTPLHFAALKGNREMVKMLIARGAAVEATKDGRRFDESPEELAARSGWPDEADLLAEAAGRPARHARAADQAIAAMKAKEAAAATEAAVKGEL